MATAPPRATLGAMSRSSARALAIAALALAATACGGGSPADPDASPPAADADTRDIADGLAALPGVSVVEMVSGEPGERHFDLTFTQPADHDAPGGATFGQNVTLVHRAVERPMIALTTGYWNYYGFAHSELAELLDANQISIEHRFFAGSRPTPPDWTTLTIAQAAADQHHIVTLLQTIYGAPWISTGASKGGMTAVYHRRFYPDDVTAAVPYVAPISFAAGDSRYPTYLDGIGPAACRQQLRDLQVELLDDTRYNAMLARAQQEAVQEGYVYNRVAIGPATESAITGLEWSFWQYVGAGFCDQLPPTTASDGQLYSLLNIVSPVSGSTDDAIAEFDAYYYQAAAELGYPADGGAHLEGLTRFTDADYEGAWPTGVAIPTHDPAVMADVDDWVQTDGSRLLFVYGEWDPWSGGKFELGAATDSLRLIAPEASHGANLRDLADPDKAAAYARLAAWTGVIPDESGLQRTTRMAPPPVEPRIPPAIVRSFQLRRR
jgi:hypothetical protein